MKYVLSVVTLFALLVGASAPARADIVVNGGFETGDFSGWTLNDPSLGTFVSSAFGGYVPNSGQYFAALEASGLLGTVSQDLTRLLGQPTHWTISSPATASRQTSSRSLGVGQPYLIR